MHRLTSIRSRDSMQFAACARWLAVGALLTILAVHAQPAQGAGCHTDGAVPTTFAGGIAGTLPKWTWWATGPMQRIYDSGELIYYQVPGGELPCRGPGCGGQVPQTSFAATASIDTQRTNLAVDRVGQAVLPPESQWRCVASSQDLPLSPVLAGPLKPPRPMSGLWRSMTLA